jgi:ammonia channel protein AmtB
MTAGQCSAKNETTMIMQGALGIVFSGFLFWAIGYGIVMGDSPEYATPFFGIGKQVSIRNIVGSGV